MLLDNEWESFLVSSRSRASQPCVFLFVKSPIHLSGCQAIRRYLPCILQTGGGDTPCRKATLTGQVVLAQSGLGTSETCWYSPSNNMHQSIHQSPFRGTSYGKSFFSVGLSSNRALGIQAWLKASHSEGNHFVVRQCHWSTRVKCWLYSFPEHAYILEFVVEELSSFLGGFQK